MGGIVVDHELRLQQTCDGVNGAALSLRDVDEQLLVPVRGSGDECRPHRHTPPRRSNRRRGVG
jgi:hypothetical protein